MHQCFQIVIPVCMVRIWTMFVIIIWLSKVDQSVLAEQEGAVCMWPSLYCLGMVRVSRELCPSMVQLILYLKNFSMPFDGNTAWTYLSLAATVPSLHTAYVRNFISLHPLLANIKFLFELDHFCGILQGNIKSITIMMPTPCIPLSDTLLYCRTPRTSCLT